MEIIEALLKILIILVMIIPAIIGFVFELVKDGFIVGTKIETDLFKLLNG
jgi:hypothetical protein